MNSNTSGVLLALFWYMNMLDENDSNRKLLLSVLNPYLKSNTNTFKFSQIIDWPDHIKQLLKLALTEYVRIHDTDDCQDLNLLIEIGIYRDCSYLQT